MTAGKPPYYITTPIYYVNDSPHIGHAYTTLACDVLARFKRLDGFNVRFLTGTDEHGQKVEKSAAAAGIDPQSFTDQVSQNFRDLSGLLNFTNDDFIRTTEQRHKDSCQALWKKLVAAGDIYLGSYAGWYAVRDEAYYAESELEDGPNNTKIAPSGAECEWVEEESYFFKLSAWGDRLLELYEANPDFILPASRRNEVISFVKGGLRDLSISRTTFNWGIPVPDAPDHIMYVWLDALTNYITALGYPDEEADNFKTFWPADVHMVGKDILRFHAVYWPAFLMSAGVQPPKRVYAHGWWTNEGQKMSKTLRNALVPAELVTTYGLDQLRYFLLREVPFGNDGDFSHSAMVGRMNFDLANQFGNLSQRVLSMIAKNCDAQVPQPQALAPEDEELLKATALLLDDVRADMDRQQFHLALTKIWETVSAANRYIDHAAPWTLKKTDPARMATVLYVLAESIRRLAIIAQPVMPDSMAKMLDQLSVDPAARDYASLERQLEPGAALPKPEPIFPRFVEDEA